jgi:hypothetical protein
VTLLPARIHHGFARAFLYLAAVFAVMPTGRTLQAQTDTTRVMISGTVVDPERQPLEGVEVRLVGDSVRRFTSRAGTFRLYAQRGTELLLQFRRPGYNAQLLKLKGEWSGTVLMVPGAFELPDIQVNARNAKPAEYAGTTKYDDYFRRRRQGLGEFITREDIDRRNPLHTFEILDGRPGIRVQFQPDRGTFVGFVRCNEYPPRINVYVDGNKLIPSGSARITGSESAIAGIGRQRRDPEIAGIVGEMLSRVNPREIEFIEIFRGPGELPPEFNDGNCGAIVIWTRQGAR